MGSYPADGFYMDLTSTQIIRRNQYVAKCLTYP